MARKKVIFVIVEGPTDEISLGVILSKYYDETVHVEIMHCDITTKKGVNSSNILKEIKKVVKEYADRNHFKPEHFKRIIHIVDTDGAFCTDDRIFEDNSVDCFVYSDSAIRVPSKKDAVARNKQKSLNLLKMTRTEYIWNIPYNTYYMSCNLEHVLFNKLNCSDEEKEQLAYQFAFQYKDNIQGFIDFISNSLFSITTDYLSSWKFIEEDNNSLKRYTNFSICF